MPKKLSKDEARQHRTACELIDMNRDLTEDEKAFVLDHWQESANVTNPLDGAFFTPEGLADDFSLVVGGGRIIDLCAGIGRLAWTCRDYWERRSLDLPPRELVCVEQNPDYVRVGRKVVPEATWICADVLDVPRMSLGRFDCVISNPPFGTAIDRRGKNAPRYRGSRFEYHVIDIAAALARYGAFIVPQASAPFRISGPVGRAPNNTPQSSEAYEEFVRQTGIHLRSKLALNTGVYQQDWRGVAPTTEIVSISLDDDARELAQFKQQAASTA